MWKTVTMDSGIQILVEDGVGFKEKLLSQQSTGKALISQEAEGFWKSLSLPLPFLASA